MKGRLILLFAVALLRTEAAVEHLRCEILAKLPRSTTGYTQGLFIVAGKLYESTGGYGQSVVRRFDLKSQVLERTRDLPKDVFGEGITPYGADRLLQVTWRRGLGFVYHRDSFQLEKVFRYPTEGWGITAQGKKIVMSDGTDRLIFLGPERFERTKVLRVTKDGKPLTKLNELEWVEDSLYANVWLRDQIVRIDPQSGVVTGLVDCRNLGPDRPSNPDAVLNGIAYDPAEKVFYLTGKLWPSLYKVRFVPR